MLVKTELFNTSKSPVGLELTPLGGLFHWVQKTWETPTLSPAHPLGAWRVQNIRCLKIVFGTYQL
jgi:hypothetical protein